MLKLDVSPWLTVKRYSEVFHKNVRQTKVQKRFIYGQKKESMEQRETNSNASYSN